MRCLHNGAGCVNGQLAPVYAVYGGMTMKTVIFDMDGVLFDTERLCMDSWVAVTKEMGLSGMEEIFPKCIGCNAKGSERFVLEAYGESFDYEGFRKRASAWFWDRIEKNGLPVKPGAEEILRSLKEDGWAIGLASSTRQSTVLNHLEHAGLREYFSAVVTGDMVEHGKPNPEIYLLACGALSAKPPQTYAIEDSPNGIRAAHAAGMMPLMVPDILAPDEEMRKLSVEIFEDLFEVSEYLKNI